jgi:hypothetical protein
MFRKALLPSLFCLISSSAFAQLPFSIGLKGGVSLTNAFQDNTYSPANTSITSTIHDFSDSKDYIIGPFAELRLPFGLGVEADALYRPLSFATTSQLDTNPVSQTFSRFSTWEFPILAKYRFRLPIVKPYIGAGPSFRTTTSDTRYLSNRGLAVGAGLDIKALIIHISPEIRYTRWGSDAKSIANTGVPAFSNVNQVEFLVGLSF